MQNISQTWGEDIQQVHSFSHSLLCSCSLKRLKENHVMVCIDNSTDRSCSSATHRQARSSRCGQARYLGLMQCNNMFHILQPCATNVHCQYVIFGAFCVHTCIVRLSHASCLDWLDQYFTSTTIIPDCRCINYEDRHQNYSPKCTEAQGRTWHQTLAINKVYCIYPCAGCIYEVSPDVRMSLRAPGRLSSPCEAVEGC